MTTAAAHRTRTATLKATSARNGSRPTAQPRVRGARVAPIGESRQQVLRWLKANGGELVDSSGRATPRLLEAVGYQGGGTGFGALMANMDRDGEIVRDLSGRRCFRIALPTAPRKAPIAPKATPTRHMAAPLEVPEGKREQDYTALALTLLNSVVDIVSAGSAPAADSSAVEACQAEISSLRAALAAKDVEIARLTGEVTRLRDERTATLDKFRATRNRTSADVQAISRLAAG